MDYHDTIWWRLLEKDKEELKICDTVPSQLFRLRFRVPYPIFEKLLLWTRSWYDATERDCCGRKAIPLELKVLGVLRILGNSIKFSQC